MLLSIITVVYNSADTILAALESVLTQEGANYELIVIDGGSTDGTLEVLNRYADRINVLVSEPDLGIYDALNKGLRRARGEAVGFLHSDDMFANSTVLATISAAFQNEDVDALYGDLIYVSKLDPSKVIRYWKAGEFSMSRLRRGWMPPHPTFYVRRSFYVKYGGFNIDYRISADYECMLRLLKLLDLRVTYIPRVLVMMRTGGASNRTLRNLFIKSREDYKALRSSGIGGVGALAWKNLSKLRQFWDTLP